MFMSKWQNLFLSTTNFDNPHTTHTIYHIIISTHMKYAILQISFIDLRKPQMQTPKFCILFDINNKICYIKYKICVI